MTRQLQHLIWGRLARIPPPMALRGPLPLLQCGRDKGAPGRGDAPQAGPPLETPHFSGTWGKGFVRTRFFIGSK